jgi:hypothetical protein
MSAPLVVERVTIGPQGAFAQVPGLDVGYRLLTKVFPLGRGKIVEREGKVFVSTPPGRQSRRGIRSKRRGHSGLVADLCHSGFLLRMPPRVHVSYGGSRSIRLPGRPGGPLQPFDLQVWAEVAETPNNLYDTSRSALGAL